MRLVLVFLVLELSWILALLHGALDGDRIALRSSSSVIRRPLPARF